MKRFSVPDCTYPGRSVNMQQLNIKRSINTIDTFEKLWKIQTNQGKLKIRDIGRTSTQAIRLDNTNIEYTDLVNILGLTLTKTGFKYHITNRIQTSHARLNRLYRFR